MSEALSELMTFRVTVKQKKQAKALCEKFRKAKVSQADVVRIGFELLLEQPDPAQLIEKSVLARQ